MTTAWIRGGATALAAALVTTACSSGGGGGTPAVQLGFVTTTSSGTEGTQVSGIAVRLDLASGPLEEAVTVEVADAGSGAATSGGDYTAFTTQTLTFAIGAVDGATQTVALDLLDDTLVEGDETIALVLQNPSAGARLAAARTHTTTVEDADEAVVQFATASTTLMVEDDVDVPLTVELELQPGDTLDVDVTVQVVDMGSGSATSGSDYDAFPPYTVTFSRLSADGATAEVMLSVRDDASVEGDETVDFDLATPSDGLVLGAQASHEVMIQDDDVSAAPHLMVEDGAPGSGSSVASGDGFDLGSEPLGGDGGAGLQLSLTNQGTDPMALPAMTLAGSNLYDFQVELELSPAPFAGGLPSTEDGAPPVRRAPLRVLGEELERGVELAFDTAALEELAALDRVTLVDVPVPGGASLVLELARVPSPWADDALVTVDGVPVPGGPDALTGDLSLWRGTVLGVPASRVFLGLSSHGSRGWVKLGPEPGDVLQLVVDAAAVERGHRVASRLVRADQLPPVEGDPSELLCGGTRSVPGQEVVNDGPGTGAFAPPTAGLTLANCRVALESDYQFYQQFGSSQALTTYVTELFAALSEQYARDAQTTLSVAYLGIHSTSNDGWGTQESGGDTGDLLDEFRAAWNGSGWPVQADLAHFLSGDNLGGGIAYVGVLCNQSFGYGVSANLGGNIDWSSWTGSPAGFTWDYVVTGHELGHNFGALHTHDYCPPVQRCYTGSCVSSVVCSRGTVMSYCHLCPGGMGNIDLQFHPFIANVIRSSVASSCLGETELGGGESLSLRARFQPMSGTGAKSATLRVEHDAGNAVSPFLIGLSGTATN